MVWYLLKNHLLKSNIAFLLMANTNYEILQLQNSSKIMGKYEKPFQEWPKLPFKGA